MTMNLLTIFRVARVLLLIVTFAVIAVTVPMPVALILAGTVAVLDVCCVMPWVLTLRARQSA